MRCGDIVQDNCIASLNSITCSGSTGIISAVKAPQRRKYKDNTVSNDKCQEKSQKGLIAPYLYIKYASKSMLLALQRKPFLLLLFSFMVSLLLHSDYLRKDIMGVHAWRQSQTMLNVRNFTRHDANILNPRIDNLNSVDDSNLYRYEFPVMQWSIAMLQRCFGESIVLVRLCIFLIGIFTCIGFYMLLSHIFKDRKLALLGSILLQCSPIFYTYTINPIPDNLALCGAVWYIYSFVIYIDQQRIGSLAVSISFLLIAGLAKLPFLMFGICSAIFFVQGVLSRQLHLVKAISFVGLHLVILTPAMLWYSWVMPTWEGNGVLSGIFANMPTIDELVNIAKYHFVDMFPLKLLNPVTTLLFLVGCYVAWRRGLGLGRYNFHVYGLAAVTLVYLILQFNMIGKVHDYYMMPFLPWMYIIVTLGIKWCLDKWEHRFLLPFILLGSAASVILLCMHNWSIRRSYIDPSLILHQSELQAVVPREAKCIMLNDVSRHVFPYTIDKQGYVFADDNLPLLWINDMIKNKEVKYMYSNSRKVDEQPGFEAYVDTLLLEVGDIRVFRLKIAE